MKNNCKNNTLEGKEREMTFSDYYNSIPLFPRKTFVDEVCKRCDVSENTVYNWLGNRSKPQKVAYYHILSEMTGIAPENLFAD